MLKNFIVKENCFRYNSSNGIFEDCPLGCRDGSKFKKYYAKSIYKLPEISQDDYYDNVEIILYQLYNYGQIEAGILVYEDFFEFGEESNCGNDIFIHDEKYSFIGSHKVDIDGYGYSDVESKYY